MYLEGSMTTKEWHTDERNRRTIMARATAGYNYVVKLYSYIPIY
jgi:hypothetical protein